MGCAEHCPQSRRKRARLRMQSCRLESAASLRRLSAGRRPSVVTMNSKELQSDSRSASPKSGRLAAPDAHDVLTENLALALLNRPDLPGDEIERISRNAGTMKSRKVRLALAAHPRAPRRVSIRVIRELHTFDLMKFALLPVVAADLKCAADELLVSRIASITLGERISLARRCSALVAAALLLDKEARVWQTALENPRLTESAIAKSLQSANATYAFVQAVCSHPKWAPRQEVRMALLRNEKTPRVWAVEFARRIPPAKLRDILLKSRLPEEFKASLKKNLECHGKTGST
jgi:hypothetical protein